MEHITQLPLLSDWQNFYMIIGTAAATLTGLMFVATSLAAGGDWNASTLDAGIEAFNTPTVVHFGAVLLIAGVLSAPWRAFSTVALVLGLLDLAAVVYLMLIMRRMRRIAHYHVPLKDWLWYVFLPLGAYIVLLAATLVLPANPELALYIISAVMVVLLLVGLHNAWDLVTFFATAHTQGSGRGGG